MTILDEPDIYMGIDVEPVPEERDSFRPFLFTINGTTGPAVEDNPSYGIAPGALLFPDISEWVGWPDEGSTIADALKPAIDALWAAPITPPEVPMPEGPFLAPHERYSVSVGPFTYGDPQRLPTGAEITQVIQERLREIHEEAVSPRHFTLDSFCSPSRGEFLQGYYWRGYHG